MKSRRWSWSSRRASVSSWLGEFLVRARAKLRVVERRAVERGLVRPNDRRANVRRLNVGEIQLMTNIMYHNLANDSSFVDRADWLSLGC